MKTFKLLIIVFMLMDFSSPLFSQWTIQHSGLPDSQNPTLAFAAVDSNVCWGFQGAPVWPTVNPKCILTTDGGDHWSPIPLPAISGVTLQSLYAIDRNTAWIAMDDPAGTSNGGIFKTMNTDGGDHWSPIPLPAISGVTLQSLYAIDRNTAWIAMDDPAGTSNGGIFKTMNGGNEWIKQETAFPGAGGHPVTIYFFDVNNGLCHGQPRNGYCEIYTTTDGGTNWIRVPSANIPTLANDDFIGFGTGAGNSYWFQTASCSVYRTTDKGLTWSVRRNVFPPPAYFVNVAFKDNLNGLAISYYGDEINKISRSTDGGVGWTRLPEPPSPPSSGGITYVPGTSGTYFITSHKNIGYPQPTVPGSIYTPDDGLTWILVDTLPHGPASFVNNNIGWSSGCGDTIFKWNGYPLGIEQQNLLNRTVTLNQNYPNPFHSSTIIQFEIPVSSNVILKVYDLLGIEVATLVNGEKSAGSYEVNFERGGLSSGIYYYRLKVGESVQTKKLCIL